MIVIVIDAAPLQIRGELTKWMLETKPGVYVGNLSGMVRDLLWEKVENYMPEINALLIYSTNNEQGFSIKMIGNPHRSVVDFDGILLIKTVQNPHSD